ncbi:MAG: phosphatidylglycerol lysyltransferase domain-containing protein [Candidatus Omnitrophota bacterium]|jgi:hypothetical protein
MELRGLTAKDKGVFDKFLALSRHELSVYAFENIYIWKGLFDIGWSVIEDSLCVFFKDRFGYFLYLPPLSARQNPLAVKRSFEFMERRNKNEEVSRVENIEGKDTPFYERLNCACREKSRDYICLRRALAGLSGNKFKSKRASVNYFIKNNEFRYLPFTARHRLGCLSLYNEWSKARGEKNSDAIYRGMLQDSGVSLKKALDNYAGLGLTGRVVLINNKVTGFTFGYRLNRDTFCILYEITDLSVKGLAQFIFREFCQELKSCRYINIMDDSGLENLKEVKLSYHPVKLAPAYIATRKK